MKTEKHLHTDLFDTFYHTTVISLRFLSGLFKKEKKKEYPKILSILGEKNNYFKYVF